ncbi:hypothetical protein B0T13DRAFT_449018 [Neurospora crassa]|nr:hypothetical protein B0T13DRAFT_449018 [Neurospora crassa]
MSQSSTCVDRARPKTSKRPITPAYTGREWQLASSKAPQHSSPGFQPFEARQPSLQARPHRLIGMYAHTSLVVRTISYLGLKFQLDPIYGSSVPSLQSLSPNIQKLRAVECGVVIAEVWREHLHSTVCGYPVRTPMAGSTYLRKPRFTAAFSSTKSPFSTANPGVLRKEFPQGSVVSASRLRKDNAFQDAGTPRGRRAQRTSLMITDRLTSSGISCRQTASQIFHRFICRIFQFQIFVLLVVVHKVVCNLQVLMIITPMTIWQVLWCTTMQKMIPMAHISAAGAPAALAILVPESPVISGSTGVR